MPGPADRVHSHVRVSSLAARVMWRMRKDGGVAWDSQLLAVQELQEHVDELPREQLQQDVHTFQQYWTCGRRQPSVEDITHVLGIVRTAEGPGR